VIVLKKLPIPPSQNEQLTINRGRFIKKKGARIFDSLIANYSLIHFKKLDAYKKELKDLLDQGFALQINMIFVFHIDRVFTKTKKAASPYKRIDTNNRIKSSIDAVSKLLEIDDMLFFFETAEKQTCDCAKDEQLIVEITHFRPRKFV
jgi:Holliday junction resolvase RusA-like endonuclease